MNKKIIVLVAVSLLGLTGCQLLEQEAKLIASYDDLKRELARSEADFTKKYNGKEVAYWGKVASINNLGEKALLRMETDVSGSENIVCSVDKADMDKFSALKIESGSIASVKGTMSVEKKGITVAELKSCKLIRPGIAKTDEK